MARLSGGRAPGDAEWQAFEARQMDVASIYAVVSTGIYCRAGCPARLPLRRNLRLFDAATLAQAAGFRACKRCKP
jgi:AraC family transcriptional regulator of adaptative response/methylated-DNA-[protein]-cysteine methyltransferase